MPERRSPSRSGPPRLQTALLLVGLALIAMAAQAPQALGHAAFLGSEPQPGHRVQRSPAQIELRFTEALNKQLSKATVIDLRTGKAIGARTEPSPSAELILGPARPLPTAAYRVDWFSVSADDGHGEAGSFSFGVRAPAIGGVKVTQQGPLARHGLLRIVLRAVFYALLFFFAGGALNALLLSRRQGGARWLVPSESLLVLASSGEDPTGAEGRAWRRTIEAGWLAAASAALVAVTEAADASGGLRITGLNDYLLTSSAGLGRVATVLTLAFAAFAASRRPRLGAIAASAPLLALAFGSHADSAHPRAVAIATDWIHLMAAAVWIGGTAQIVLTWASPALKGGPGLRRALMAGVLARFGHIALPAFLVVVISGLVNALIELGHPSELWQSGYGRALAVKMSLVGVVALLSYLHALRLRPRLLAANPHPQPNLERRHWRLLRSEPGVALGIVAVAAVLVAFPLPPRQRAGAAQAVVGFACNPCPLPSARDDQLAVADHVGPAIAAVWLRREANGLSGRVRLLSDQLKAIPSRPTIPGAALSGCGPGCWDLRIRGHPATITVRAPVEGRTYAARLPTRWVQRQNASEQARDLLVGVQNKMNTLHTLREYERITSGPGSFAATHFRLEAPNRFAYRTNVGSEAVTIGKRSWDKVSGASIPGSAHPWRGSRYSGGGPPFTTHTWFRWTPYAEAVRLLAIHRQRGHRVAEVALYDRATPTWWRLRIDLGSMLSPRTRLIAEGHFMTEHYYGFNRPLTIEPPPAVHGG